ncbi:MAG TPA: hypothetical protein VK641_11770 [Terriglobales bacterium]|nr:hypothetical protein [Terriglobales bacterium]
MNTKQSFSPQFDLRRPDAHSEARLSAFISAGTESPARQQAMLSAEDWLEELTVAPDHRTPVLSSSTSTDTKVWPIPSSNCFASRLLV